MNKLIIQNNFSRYAHMYDTYADIQKRLACELMGQLYGFKGTRILEIGCGTGYFTELLHNAFPHVFIQAVDISSEMIHIAQRKFSSKNVQFLLGDGEQIQSHDVFDMIVSNACFQWFDDVESALKRYFLLLNKNGVLAFSLFGQHTFFELQTSLMILGEEDMQLNAGRFVAQQYVEQYMKTLFPYSCVQKKIYREEHSSLLHFFKKIKYSGVNGTGIPKKRIWTPQLVSQVEEEYKKKFGGIKATYEVFLCRGEK